MSHDIQTGGKRNKEERKKRIKGRRGSERVSEGEESKQEEEEIQLRKV